MPTDESPLHQFPDRAIRRLQAMPAHLRELVRAVAPALELLQETCSSSEGFNS